ncbi:phospholipase D-like domain-containing protein [Rhizobium halophytocola]|uniref:Phospholipase D n=1 Tax=Rhizobium halophytocola TaxID=735519 RepID=A0ABS4DXL4_9HYPH|nr:phospholipase D-like domain-containing protein [Rhizobium halophytocola]MBP1850438.1 phosphatidylserine/phosphatidylglycerophosphate/cardiolipin synthase-like enzyme [Rhizobium halophytocola]
MRSSEKADGFSVHAISGSHAVLLAMNATPEARRHLAGFAIGMVGPEGPRWLRGFKFFKSRVPDPKPGERRSTHDHPIQSFLWGHYSAEPGERYHYVIRPMFFPADGDPAHLRPGTDLTIAVRTEESETGTHSVFFNRGAIVSQAFAERFGNRAPANPDDPADEEVRWLSRGLLEAALGFIAEAGGPSFELRCCFYELTYKPVLDALRAAAMAGAKVQVIFDAGHVLASGELDIDVTAKANLETVAQYADVAGLTFHKRTRHISIPHNKFMILLKDGVPQTLWTGSTNITPSGFLGQTNVGHLVRDPVVASTYNDYWQQLATDPDRKQLKAWVDANNPEPKGPLPGHGTSVVFSPRPSQRMLKWYGERIDAAEQTVMLTAAFGVTRELAAHFDNDRDYLRFLLMERANASPETQAMLERDRDTRIALGMPLGRDTFGRKLPGWKLDQWLLEEDHFRHEGHVFYVHTKLMAIDPLTASPQIFSGSANFSPASLSSNDENMLLISGDSRVADIYTTEFFRLFNHFYFRTVANAVAGRGQAPGQGPDADGGQGGQLGKVVYLDPTDRWTNSYFQEGSYHSRRRTLFGVSPS